MLKSVASPINPRPHKYRRRLDSFYLNVPRLIRQARIDGVDIPLPRNGDFSELRLLSHDQLMDFRERLEAYVAGGAFSAVRINRVVDWTRVPPGRHVSMAHDFTAEEIPDVFAWPKRRPLPNGEVGHACREIGGWRIWLDIEPRWIVSNSGALMFLDGIGRLTGLATVKNVVSRDSIVYASPLILGL